MIQFNFFYFSVANVNVVLIPYYAPSPLCFGTGAHLYLLGDSAGKEK